MNEENDINEKQNDTFQPIQIIASRFDMALRVFALALFFYAILLSALLEPLSKYFISNSDEISRILFLSNLPLLVIIVVSIIIKFFYTKNILNVSKSEKFFVFYIVRFSFGLLGFILGLLVINFIKTSFNVYNLENYNRSLDLASFAIYCFMLTSLIYLFISDISNIYIMKYYNSYKKGGSGVSKVNDSVNKLNYIQEESNTLQPIYVSNSSVSFLLRIFSILLIIYVISLLVITHLYEDLFYTSWVTIFLFYLNYPLFAIMSIASIFKFFSIKNIINAEKLNKLHLIYIFRLIFGIIGLVFGILISILYSYLVQILPSFMPCNRGLSCLWLAFFFMAAFCVLLISCVYLFSTDIANHYFVKYCNRKLKQKE